MVDDESFIVDDEVIDEYMVVNPITSMELLDMVDDLCLEPEVEEILYEKFNAPEVSLKFRGIIF